MSCCHLLQYLGGTTPLALLLSSSGPFRTFPLPAKSDSHKPTFWRHQGIMLGDAGGTGGLAAGQGRVPGFRRVPSH